MKVGELIGVATTDLVAQSYALNVAPSLGALLRIPLPSSPAQRGAAYYALCSGFETASIEPGRYAVAWGSADEGEDDDIYRRQPQLSLVLRTTFEGIFVGYDDGVSCRQRLPSSPPPLHAAVYTADTAELRRFHGLSVGMPGAEAALGYLRLLLRAPLPHADDLIAAVIENAYHALGDERPFLVTAARTVARLLEPEHERVMNILEVLYA